MRTAGLRSISAKHLALRWASASYRMSVSMSYVRHMASDPACQWIVAGWGAGNLCEWHGFLPR